MAACTLGRYGTAYPCICKWDAKPCHPFRINELRGCVVARPQYGRGWDTTDQAKSSTIKHLGVWLKYHTEPGSCMDHPCMDSTWLYYLGMD